MSLIYQGVAAGRFDLNRFVELTSTAAAKSFGLFPKKGTLAVGSDADIVIFDPDKRLTIGVNEKATHHMRVDYNPYEGVEVVGYPETVISRGRVIVERGSQRTKGGGRFVPRARVGELIRA